MTDHPNFREAALACYSMLRGFFNSMDAETAECSKRFLCEVRIVSFFHMIFILMFFPLCLSLIITYVNFQAAEQAASRPGELGYTIALAARYLDFHIQYSINAIILDLKIYVELFM